MSNGPKQYAQERSREVSGGLVERAFGPASPASQRAARGLRLTVAPVVALWRPTSRGIGVASRFFNIAARWPAISGTEFKRRLLGGVPVEWSVAPRAREADDQERVILYLHGGGFVTGSTLTHRNLVSRISSVTATPVASVEYRMVPSASIQASQSDAFAAYKGLLEAGYPAKSIVVAGDSAGGNLAAYVALQAIDQGVPVPAALILLSPWLDLMDGGPSRTANTRTEFFIGGSVLDRIARVLVPDGTERAFWRNSPINAPDDYLAQLPPTLIQIGSAEVLADDGVLMGRRMGAAGGTVEVQTYDGQGHVVALWAGNPEARRALAEIADWLRDALPTDRQPDEPPRAAIDEAAGSGAPADIGGEAFPG